MYPYRILIVDDEPSQLDLLSGYLKKRGLRVSTAHNGEAALKMLDDRGFEIALLDLRLPGMDGIELMRRLREGIPDISVVIITAHGDVKSAVEAMKIGAIDYLNKPIDLEELMTIITKAGERFKMLSENRALKEVIEQPLASIEFIGRSPLIQKLLATVYKVAETDSTVLITGESGTGKELVAGMIHRASKRFDKPFIPVACGALPETMLESELFGHEKGAYTGADRMRLGRFELASGGSLFLDEVAEISLDVQAKLLRVLEERKVIRLGGEEFIEIDPRIITATNRNLSEEVQKGNFRNDLYYRLNVIEIHIPPLRERKEDIPILAEHFISQYSKGYKKEIKGLTSEVKDVLIEYPWPGNVRELKNLIERAVVLCSGDSLTPDDLPSVIRQKADTGSLPEGIVTIKDAEKYMIEKSLRKNDWNITVSASELGLHRNTLAAKIKEYEILK